MMHSISLFLLKMNNCKIFHGMKCIGAVDAGTTSCRFIVFDEQVFMRCPTNQTNLKGHVVAKSQSPLPQVQPQEGWVEHEPMQILACIDTCVRTALSTTPSLPSLSAIGIANQRGTPCTHPRLSRCGTETLCVWDRETGAPLHNAIVWLDTRTAASIPVLTARAAEMGIDTHTLAGLPISTYFSAVKLAWLLTHVPAVREAHDTGRLMVGTVDTWILYKWTGEHVTEPRARCSWILPP